MFQPESRDQKSEQGFSQKSKDIIELKERSVQRPHLSGANKRMFNLLRKAKVQLIKIDQQKQLKSSGVGMKLFIIFFFFFLMLQFLYHCMYSKWTRVIPNFSVIANSQPLVGSHCYMSHQPGRVKASRYFL